MFRQFLASMIVFAVVSAFCLAGNDNPPVKPAPAVKQKLPQNITVSSVQGTGNTVIVSSNGQGSVKVITRQKGQGNRISVTHNGKRIVPEKIGPKQQHAEREIQRALQEIDRILQALDRD